MYESQDREGRGDEHGEAKMGKQTLARAAYFDYSVENFFAAMDSISAFCGEPFPEIFPTSQMERFSSMIIFLKEWRQFCYESKILNFSYETESVGVNKFGEGVTLPQFSSAAVPEMEPLPENLRSSRGNDFVLHAGGPVWALDWCPRADENLEDQLKCEYLAVAAHPPGSSYHKIGAPLVGRGLIQIWCLVSMGKKEKLSQAKTSGRGRPRKRHADDELLNDSNNNEVLHVPKPRARPRKIPKLSADDVTREEILPARPRGRPRKYMQQELTGSARPNGIPKHALENVNEKEVPPCSEHLILSTMECMPGVNVDPGEVSMEVPILADVRDEPPLPRRRGRPRKKAHFMGENVPKSGEQPPPHLHDLILNTNEDMPHGKFDSDKNAFASPISAEITEELATPKHGGRPRKALNSVNKSLAASAVALDEYAMNSDQIFGTNAYISPLDVDLGEVALSLPVSANVSINCESDGQKRRGRPRKKPCPSLNKCVSESVVELLGDASGSDLLASTNDCMPPLHISLGNIALPMTTSANLVVEKESCVCSLDNTPTYGVKVDAGASGSNLIFSREDCLSPLNVEHVASPLTTSALSIIEEKSFRSGHSGKPRESIMPSANNCIPSSGADLEADASGSQLTFNSNESMAPLNSYFGKVASACRTSGNICVEENSFVRRRRGRPRKKFIRSPSKTVSTSVDLKLFTSEELATSRENCISVGFQTELILGDSCEVVRDGREETMSALIPYLRKEGKENSATVLDNNLTDPFLPVINEPSNVVSNDPNSALSESFLKDEGLKIETYKGFNDGHTTMESAPTSQLKAKDMMRVVSNNSSSMVLSVESEQQNLPEVLQSYGSASEREIFTGKEVTHSPLPKADIPCSHIPETIALPRVVLFLAHNGKVAWDVKWRPKTSSKPEDKQLIGYLAVLLGNSSLEVWEVPQPSLVKSLYISSRIEGTDPRFLKVDPVFKSSKIRCGDRQCIPLTVEWSRSSSCDLILVGCHDGTVALWKFSTHRPSQDAKPLLCFTADTGPIRALAWAPEESDPESLNLVVTAGQEGLKFWDLRDPHRPLWELCPVQRSILSLEWLKDPRCIIISLDDGTLRFLSLWNLPNDVPVIGKPSDATKQRLGWHNYYCSSSALWSVQVSRSTGLAAYCSAEGSTYHFQLTVKSLKDSRNRVPHLLCGSLMKDGEMLTINTPLLSTPPSVTKHMRNCVEVTQALPSYPMEGTNQAGSNHSKHSVSGNGVSFLPEMKKPKSKLKNGIHDISQGSCPADGDGESKSQLFDFPDKILAIHKVRWNMNKGSERWLCYGGAAGIVRCQEIS